MTVKNTSNKGEIVVIHNNFVWPAGNSISNGYSLNDFDSNKVMNAVFLNPGGSCTCQIHNFKFNYNNYIIDCGALRVYDVAY